MRADFWLVHLAGVCHRLSDEARITETGSIFLGARVSHQPGPTGPVAARSKVGNEGCPSVDFQQPMHQYHLESLVENQSSA